MFFGSFLEFCRQTQSSELQYSKTKLNCRVKDLTVHTTAVLRAF